MQSPQTPSDLPQWAANAIGRALITEIIAVPSESRLVRDDWGCRDHPTYAGKLAARLRRVHDEWLSREFAMLDTQFRVTGFWDEAASKALFRTENADQLIHRLLRESVGARKAA